MRNILYIILISAVVCSCKNDKKSLPKESETVPDKMGAVLLDNINLSSGKIYRIDSFSTKLIQPRTVDVWLPDDYSEDKKYAVLYMHDGQMLFDATKTWNKQEWKVDEIATKLIKKDTVNNFIVVAIWNIPEIRWQDYFPEKALNYLSKKDSILMVKQATKNNFNIDLHADNYLKFITNELKPYIDKQYSTFTDKAHTFMAGSSMGALISMYAVCEYPNIFGGAACISTHWPGVMPSDNNPVPKAIFNYMEDNVPPPNNHKFYFDYGTETLDAFYPQYLKDVDKIFNEKGYNSTNYMNLEFEGADHSEESWNRRLDIPLIFLLKK